MAFITSEFIIATLLGLVLGSFATAITYREQRDISWLTGRGEAGAGGSDSDSDSDSEKHPTKRSACPNCKEPLKPRDLVPLFSWMLLRGKCRYCHEKIGTTYPLMEISVLIGCLGIYSVYGLSVTSFYLFLSIPFMAALFVIDIRQMILPNRLVAALGVLALLTHASQLILQEISLKSSLYEFGGGLVIYAAIAWLAGIIVSKILKKESLGLGDVKFFAVAGLWLGTALLPWFFLLSGLCGVALSVLWGRKNPQKTFPFGPALILSLYVLLLIKG